MTALSVPFLGERVGWRRWTAIGVGFAGMLVVVRPGFAEFSLPMLYAVAGAVLWAVYQVILKIVGRHFNVGRTDLLSPRRARSVVVPRQIGMYLAKKMTARSLPEIGRRFGGRDHSTVLHAVRKIEDQIKTDDKLAREVALLIRLVEQG